VQRREKSKWAQPRSELFGEILVVARMMLSSGFRTEMLPGYWTSLFSATSSYAETRWGSDHTIITSPTS
jgi:hypothetical protein